MGLSSSSGMWHHNHSSKAERGSAPLQPRQGSKLPWTHERSRTSSLASQRDRSPPSLHGVQRGVFYSARRSQGTKNETFSRVQGSLLPWQGSKGTESILLPTSLKEAFKGKGFLSTKSVSERKKHSARSAEEAASCSVSEARSMKRKKHSGGQGEQSSPWKASCFTPTTCG